MLVWNLSHTPLLALHRTHQRCCAHTPSCFFGSGVMWQYIHHVCAPCGHMELRAVSCQRRYALGFPPPSLTRLLTCRFWCMVYGAWTVLAPPGGVHPSSVKHGMIDRRTDKKNKAAHAFQIVCLGLRSLRGQLLWYQCCRLLFARLCYFTETKQNEKTHLRSEDGCNSFSNVFLFRLLYR